MTLTRNILLEAIRRKPLLINTCSMCGYLCHFSFRADQLGYDSGCLCTDRSEGWQPSEPESLDFYLNPAHGWIEGLTKFVEGTDVKT